MDDGKSAINRGASLSPVQCERMHAFIARVIASASLRLGFCDAMCTAYDNRFGRSFQPFQNTVDVARWAPLAKRDLGARTPIRLLYTGSVLGFSHAESLVESCTAVATLPAE